MSVLNFILSYWDSILTVVFAAAGVLFLYKKGETQILTSILFRLVTQAEREYGGGTGELKKATVIEWAYARMPAVLKFSISQKELEEMIDSVLEYAKGRWEANPALKQFVSAIAPATTEDADV